MSTLVLNTPLTIAGIIINQDDNGRYCLNDLHKAAGGEKRHSPNYFTENQQTKELIDEIRNSLIITDTGIPVSDKINSLEPINMIKGFGTKQGTYGVKDIVYAYAMWISPSFTLKVIRSYDALVTGKIPYGLKALPEHPTITKAQQGILFNRVKTISGGSGKIRAELWSRFQNHFKLSSYKDLPADKLDEAMAYLDLKEQEYSQGVEMLWLSNVELDGIVAERLMALPKPTPLEGDVMPKASKNTLSVDLNMMDGLRKITFDFKTNAYQNGRWAMWQSDGNFSIRVMDDDEFLISSQQLPKYIADSMGGMIKRDHLPSIIEAAAVRLKN